MSKISHRKELISLCSKYNLPINVKSTSIKIYNKISNKLPVDTLLYTILAVSAKCEEVHEINIPIRTLKNEGDVHEALDFEYDFPSPYLIMCSILLKIPICNYPSLNYANLIFNYEVMDKLLVLDDDNFSDKEKACVALGLNDDDLIIVGCDIEKVKECKKLLNKGDSNY